MPAQARAVFLAYRRPDLDSPAGEFARAMLRRIAARTVEHVGLRP